MKIVETDPRWYFKPFNGLLNWMVVDTSRITSEATARGAWGAYHAGVDDEFFKDDEGKVVMIDDPWTQSKIPARQMQSMIWNAERFERLVYVDGKLRGWALSTRKPGADWKRTVIMGVKLNGRQAITYRHHHTDAASAAGTLGANAEQSTGDQFGPA